MTVPSLELLSEHACFDGVQRFYRHTSDVIGLAMRFSVFLPHAAQHGKVPALFCLAGLTCTEETFMIKAGAQRFAAQHGLMLVAPDTSPRGAGVAGEDVDYDLGTGAGFYLDATQDPWRQHYRMESYVAQELFELVTRELPGDAARVGITGHSMGGHGALVLALRHPGRYRSVSAFAPIAAAARCPWGHKALAAYLGAEQEQIDPRAAWRQHDAAALIAATHRPLPGGILIDQGLEDQFLVEQLQPEMLEAACAQADQPLTLRRHAGYDHSYYFIATFVGDHIAFHAQQLHGAM